MSAACVLQSSKRAPIPGPSPGLYELTTTTATGHNHSARGAHDDDELRNSSNQINYQPRHSSTPYSQGQNPQINRRAAAAALRPIRLSQDFPTPPPPALDVHELDLTPRLVFNNKAERPCSSSHNDGHEQTISPFDDEPSFVTRPAAVYEQQPALGQRLSAQFKPLPNCLDLDCSLSTFKRNGARVGGTADNPSRQQRGASQPALQRADCNSLDSFQSRSSASSGVASPVALATTCQPLHRQSSVLVGTRYVRPPAVPGSPATIAQATPPQTTTGEWREVPLADSQEPAPKSKSRGRKESSFGSLVWTCANVRSNKSGIGGGGGGSEKQQKSPEAKSPARGKSPPLPKGVDQSRHEHHRLSLTKVGDSKFASEHNDKRERRASARGSAASASSSSSRPAGQIGKSRAPFLFAGILGSILASLFFSLGLLTIKLLPDDPGLAEKTKIVCFRGLAIMILCAATIVAQKSTFLVRRDELLVNVLRSLLGFAGIFGAYVALKYISMGDSTALVFSSPVWTSLLSHFILNEPLQWIQLVALPLSIVGIVLIAHPSLLINMEQQAGFSERQPLIDVVDADPGLGLGLLPSNDSSQAANQSAAHLLASVVNAASSQLQQLNTTTGSPPVNQDLDIATNTSEHFDYEHRWKGILIALLCSFIVSFVYIVLKFRKSTPIQTTTFWLGFTTFAGALALGCVVGFGAWPASATEWALLTLNGVCSWLGQCLLQWALKYEDASVLSVVRTLDVAVTFTLSALFLQEEILWTSILGAAIIATVVVSIMLNNYISSRLCPARDASGALDKTGGSLRSSVTLSTGEPSGELADLQDQVANKTAHDDDDDHPESRHASVAA